VGLVSYKRTCITLAGGQ